MPAAFRTFLMAGHNTLVEWNRQLEIPSADAALLLDLAGDAAVLENASYAGLSPLAAWLSNRQAMPACMSRHVEDVALAMLDNGADALEGLEGWLEGNRAPDVCARPPATADVQAWLRTVNPCPLASAFAMGASRVLPRLLDAIPASARAATLDRLRCNDGRPLLHAAAAEPSCDTRLVSILLAAGASPNVRDDSGATPLHAATTPDAVRTLISKGADPDIRDNAGRACWQAWSRRMERNASLAMKAALPKGSPRRSVRDMVFVEGMWSGDRERLEARLRQEGCLSSLHDLAWLGATARMLGLLGRSVSGTPGCPARFLRYGLYATPGRPDWLQACFILAVVARREISPGASAERPSETTAREMLDAAGATGLSVPNTVHNAMRETALIAARSAIHGFPDDFVARLDDMALRMAAEGAGPGGEDVAKALFGAVGTALVAAIGPCDRLVEMLAAARSRWPRETEEDILAAWSGSPSSQHMDATVQPSPRTIEVLCPILARVVADSRWTHSLSGLRRSLLRHLHAWDADAWRAAGDATGAAVQALAAAVHAHDPDGASQDGQKERLDWSLLDTRRRLLSSPSNRSPRHRA